MDEECETDETSNLRRKRENYRMKMIGRTQIKLWRFIIIMAAIIVALIAAYIVCLAYLIKYHQQTYNLKSQLVTRQEECNCTLSD